jgi:Adenylate and Guanylate cyclase catalytic domain
VAVAGVPEARRDHAPAMAMFAKEVLEKFEELVEKLEVELGPDTTELGLRTGLHTGPVTAGVLRGDRARFQLFGDSVNTTARIETTGQEGRIHLSEECAEELRKFGKGSWVVPRKDKVTAKGKGVLSTCWLEIKDDEEVSDGEDSFAGNDNDDGEERALPVRGPSRKLMGSRCKSQFELLDEKNSRLIEWNTETLKTLLESVVRCRGKSRSTVLFDEEAVNKKLRKGKMVFDEVAEIIKLPHFDQASENRDEDPVELGIEVVGQIRSYVSTIAKLVSGKDQKQEPWCQFSNPVFFACLVPGQPISQL